MNFELYVKEVWNPHITFSKYIVGEGGGGGDSNNLELRMQGSTLMGGLKIYQNCFCLP